MVKNPELVEVDHGFPALKESYHSKISITNNYRYHKKKGFDSLFYWTNNAASP